VQIIHEHEDEQILSGRVIPRYSDPELNHSVHHQSKVQDDMELIPKLLMPTIENFSSLQAYK